jgi:hypothetical protein
MSGPEAGHVRSAGYVRAKGQTCLVQTDLAVPEKSETTQKFDNRRIWHC